MSLVVHNKTKTQNVLAYSIRVSQSSVAKRLKCGGILMIVLSQIFLKCVSEKNENPLGIDRVIELA